MLIDEYETHRLLYIYYFSNYNILILEEMKKNYHLIKHVILMSFLILIGSTVAYSQATLTHSYTFEDGTADDEEGSVDGTIVGDAYISDGALILNGDGYVSLSGADIDVPSYGSISFEAVYRQAEGFEEQNVNAMLFSFGELSTTNTSYGMNYLYYQPTRAGATESRFSISCLNADAPWSAETVVAGNEITDTTMHYVACIINATDIKIYQDGALLGTESLSDDNSLANIGADSALLGGPIYPQDTKWEGELHEFNIFSGELSEETIVQRASDLLGIAITDATLSDITTSRGELNETFDPDTRTYTVYLDKGITNVTLSATPTVTGASAVMYEGDVELEDGYVSWDIDDVEGTDIEIVCTALNGTNTKEYYVSFEINDETESALLTDIQVSTGTVTSDFDPDTTEYYAVMPYGTTSVTVTAEPAYSGANVSITGDGLITFDDDGLATATITVTSSDESDTRDYTLNLGVSKVTTGQYYYIVNEPSDNMVLGGSHEDDDPTPKLCVALKDETSQLFQFVSTGTENEYYIKNQAGSYLSPDANSDYVYDMIMLDAIIDDADSSKFVLNEYEPGRFKIYTVARTNSEDSPENNMVAPNDPGEGEVVYSNKWEGSTWDEDGSGTIVWNILPPDEVVDPYDTYLSDLSVDGARFYPDFSLTTYTYYITVPVGTTSININATANDASATTISTNGNYTLSGDDTDTIKVTVTATEDNSYSHTYTIICKTDTPLSLTHSYTFEDGTAQDQVGTADGTIEGSGSITEGLYTSEEDGDYIELPGDEIALYDYPSITLEAYVHTGENEGWTYLGYFGDDEGANSFRTSIAGGDDVSRVAFSAGYDKDEITGDEPDAEEDHHYVAVLSWDSMYFYIDGALVEKMETDSNNSIMNIGTDYAYIGKGGWSSDPTWVGSIYEFNIYTGQMSADSIASRAYKFPEDDTTTDATLSDLALDGTTIDDFASHKLTYNVVLEDTETTPPAVTATTTYVSAEAVVTDATAIPGTAIIVVTAPNGETQNTYKVNFSYEVSEEATLSDLTVDGTTIAGFDSSLTSYTVLLDVSVTTIPTVAATAADDSATVTITQATAIPGTATIVVTAQDGETTSTYSVLFKYDVSEDATLSDLTVDGAIVTGFNASTTTYIVSLPSSTTTVPSVSATASDSGADIVITDATSIPGTTSIVVTAADEVTKKNYTISFIYSSALNSVEENSETQVYPTVFTNSFTVNTSGGSYTISVMDVTGKVVEEQRNTMGEVEISVANPGMYFVKVEGDGVVDIFKVFNVR